jgi:phosphopantothenate-cysteine ligase
MTVLRAVVTAGGTSEKIDDVRVVTNLSSGRLGAEIALALAEQGVRTELITSGIVPKGGGRALNVVRTHSTADLQSAILDATAHTVDVFFMAAAVSDYAPQQARGKIKSDADQLVVTMGRAPKILPTLRDQCGEGTFLIGFKLMSGVSRDTLLATARKQVADNRTDACFANDLADLQPDRHPAVLVLAHTEASLDGTKADVARALVERVLAAIDPWRSRRLAPAISAPIVDWADPEDWAAARQSLKVALRLAGIDAATADDPAAVPMRADGALIGLIVRGPNGESVPYVLPDHRSSGIGDVVSERLAERGHHVLAPWADRTWWVARGWRPLEAMGAAIRLEPPGLRAPDRTGASVALIHGPTDRVLLGKRLRTPALGQWAFPGGGTEVGEHDQQTALRELLEETGIAFEPNRPPDLVTQVYISDADGLTHRVMNLLWTVEHAPHASPSSELEARWIALDEVDALSPVAAGVRRVLRRWRDPEEAAGRRPK